MGSSTNFDNNRQAWMDETGLLPVPMTNDYMFKAVCQEDNRALRSLICAVLHKNEDEVKKAAVGNPIMLGKAIDEKEYVLDAKVELNDQVLLDMEMQVLNDGDWPERSLQYLCRLFDSLNHGDRYIESKAAMHIGILSFKLYEDIPLLTSYLLMNRQHHRVYTDKFQIHVLTLRKADKPENEDIQYHTDLWAKYFAARTWEDLKMLAEKDKGIESAAVTAHRLWQQDEVRERAIAREDFIRRQKTLQAKMEKIQAGLAEAESRLAAAEERAAASEEELRMLKERFGLT